MEVPKAAMAVLAEREARHPPRERIPTPSAGLVEREDLEIKASVEMAELEVLWMSSALEPRPPAALGVLVETELWVETEELAAMRTP
jgi:hypothetical protein